MRNVAGWEGWRWLFALEGGLTAIIGVLSWFYLPPSPTQTASWFRGKDGWFTEQEEIIMVNRVLRDDPAKVYQPSVCGKSELTLYTGGHAQPPRLNVEAPVGIIDGLRPLADVSH